MRAEQPQTINEAAGGASAVDRGVRVLWPKEHAPLKIKARCPICGAGLLLNAGEAIELDGTTSEWIATEINLDCESEPDMALTLSVAQQLIQYMREKEGVVV